MSAGKFALACLYGQRMQLFCSEKYENRPGIKGEFSGSNLPFSAPKKETDKTQQDVLKT